MIDEESCVYIKIIFTRDAGGMGGNGESGILLGTDATEVVSVVKSAVESLSLLILIAGSGGAVCS